MQKKPEPLAGCVFIRLGSIKTPTQQQSIIDALDNMGIYYEFYGSHWENCDVMVLADDEEDANIVIQEWKEQYIVSLKELSLEHLIHLYKEGEITGEEFKEVRSLEE